jgi:hypothetical protein
MPLEPLCAITVTDTFCGVFTRFRIDAMDVWIIDSPVVAAKQEALYRIFPQMTSKDNSDSAKDIPGINWTNCETKLILANLSWLRRIY